MILSKNKIKYFSSFSQKKVRDANRMFVAEGTKLVRDLIDHFDLAVIVATEEWFVENDSDFGGAEVYVCGSSADMGRISQLTTPTQVYALFRYREDAGYASVFSEPELILALDAVQNPGNLGTIIRIADWFGIHHIFATYSTADVYNPKVVQATMGALSRVTVHYCDLPSVLSIFRNEGYPIYGTFLDGVNLYHALGGGMPAGDGLSCGAEADKGGAADKSKGVIVLGNEGNGISAEVESEVTSRLLIPNFPADMPTSESLNVAVAAAVIVAEFRRS